MTRPCALYPAELSGVLHQCHILASEMVHFIHQMQYYITFEVRSISSSAVTIAGCKTSVNRISYSSKL